MNKVRCCNCEKEFDEKDIVYDGNTDTEYCPYCGESGCLMDLEDEDKTLYELATEMLEIRPYLRTGFHPELFEMVVSEYSDVLDEVVFYVEKEWLKQYVKENYDVTDLNYWLENEYTSEESEPILFDGIRAGVVAGVYKA